MNMESKNISITPLGIGFDSVVTIRSHKLPVLRGFLMYLTAVIQTILLNHNPIRMQIETEDQKWEQSNLSADHVQRSTRGRRVHDRARGKNRRWHFALCDDQKCEPPDDVPH